MFGAGLLTRVRQDSLAIGEGNASWQVTLAGRDLERQGVYLGLLNTYHGETIQPIPADKPWMDRVNVQLAFSRNGVTWQRVGGAGAILAQHLRQKRDWKEAAQQATFLPRGRLL